MTKAIIILVVAGAIVLSVISSLILLGISAICKAVANIQRGDYL